MAINKPSVRWQKELKLLGITKSELRNYKENDFAKYFFRRCGGFVLNHDETIKKPYELTNVGTSILQYADSPDY